MCVPCVLTLRRPWLLAVFCCLLQFGLSLDLENVGEVLFSRPDPSYKRMIASQRERIENMVELDENY